jgi:hypothetical protein
VKTLALVFLFFVFQSRAIAAETGVARRPAPRAAATTAASLKPAAVKTARGKARDNGVGASVLTDGAMVYTKPDFDADVLTKLKKGQRVRVSRGVRGEYAKFHKVRAGSVLGWIAEIDVKVDGAPRRAEAARERQANEPRERTSKRAQAEAEAKAKAKDKREAESPREKKPFMDESLPIFFTKYVGVLAGASEFVESVSGVDSHETLLVYGLKVTGPDVLLTGPVMDFNIALHYGAPSYYDSLSSTKPGGFVLMSDALLLYPFFNRDKAMITFGLGPLLKFSNFSVTSGGDAKSLTELDAGVSLALGGAVKFGKIAVRLEGKYMLEKHQEKLFQLAVQQQF